MAPLIEILPTGSQKIIDRLKYERTFAWLAGTFLALIISGLLFDSVSSPASSFPHADMYGMAAGFAGVYALFVGGILIFYLIIRLFYFLRSHRTLQITVLRPQSQPTSEDKSVQSPFKPIRPRKRAK